MWEIATSVSILIFDNIIRLIRPFCFTNFSSYDIVITVMKVD